MGTSTSRLAVHAEDKGARLTLSDLENAAREKSLSSWWLEANRLKILFGVFDTDKNGTLDPSECARAIRELGRLGNHCFGVHIDPETASAVEEFFTALGRAEKAGDVAMAAAVPLSVRTTEMKCMLGARARLETRQALLDTQLETVTASIEAGTQPPAGLATLRQQAQPVAAAVASARDALPALEDSYLRQHNVASSLLVPKLLAAVDAHEDAYQPLAIAEQPILEKIGQAVSKLNASHAQVPTQELPAGASKFGGFEASLPPAADTRAHFAHSFSVAADDGLPTTTLASSTPPPASHAISTLLLLLGSASRCATPLRALGEHAFRHAVEFLEAEANAQLLASQEALAGGKGPPKKVEKKPSKKGKQADVGGGTSAVRDALDGPRLKTLASCCADAHEMHGGNYLRLLDLLSVSVSFDSMRALQLGLEWLCDAKANGGFEAVSAVNQFGEGWDIELSGGARAVIVNGLLSVADGSRLQVQLRLLLRSVALAGLPSAIAGVEGLLESLDLAQPNELVNASYRPLSKAVLDRVGAATVRRVVNNDVPPDADAKAWERGEGIEAMLKIPAPKNHLLELRANKEQKAASSGRYLEQVLGATFSDTRMVVQFTRIRVLQLGGNGLKGTLPEALITCTNLTTLELHQNDIEGKIPDALGTALINLVTLRLDHNSLTGELPSQWNCPRLESLDVSHNLLTGPVPKKLVANCTRLHTLDGSHCRLNGNLPGAENGGEWNCAGLKILRLEYNRLQGEIPRELFEKCVALEYVQLGSNTLSGDVPRTVRNLLSLREFDIHTNYFTGSVPCLQFKECKSLKMLNLMNQKGDEPLVARSDDGAKADLIAALPSDKCDIMWPGDESNQSAKAEREKRLTLLKTHKTGAEKRLEIAMRSLRDAAEISTKAEESLKQLMDHVNKTRARVEEAKQAQKEASEKLKSARVDSHDSNVAYLSYLNAVKGSVEATS